MEETAGTAGSGGWAAAEQPSLGCTAGPFLLTGILGFPADEADFAFGVGSKVTRLSSFLRRFEAFSASES